MTKYILSIIVLTLSLVSYAGNNTKEKGNNNTQLISGKIIDKVSGEEIAGAEIILDNIIVYSDMNGNFSANININKPELIVRSISYTESKVLLNTFSYNTLLIELASK